MELDHKVGCVSCEKSLTLVFPAVFREFRFTSEVPIWLDYHGKHVVIEQVRDHSHNKTCSKTCNEAVMDKSLSRIMNIVMFCPFSRHTGNICRNPDWTGSVKLLRVEAEEAMLQTWVKFVIFTPQQPFCWLSEEVFCIY